MFKCMKKSLIVYGVIVLLFSVFFVSAGFFELRGSISDDDDVAINPLTPFSELSKSIESEDDFAETESEIVLKEKSFEE